MYVYVSIYIPNIYTTCIWKHALQHQLQQQQQQIGSNTQKIPNALKVVAFRLLNFTFEVNKNNNNYSNIKNWTVTEYPSIISNTHNTHTHQICKKKKLITKYKQQHFAFYIHTTHTHHKHYEPQLLPLLLLLPANNNQQPTTNNNNQQQLLLLQQTICNPQSAINCATNTTNNKQQHQPPQQQLQIQNTTPYPKKIPNPKKKNKKPKNVFPGLSRILARRLQTGRVGMPVRASAGERRAARRWFHNGLHGRREGQMRTWPLPLLSSPPAPTGTIKSGPNTRHRCRCCSCGMAISIFTFYTFSFFKKTKTKNIPNPAQKPIQLTHSLTPYHCCLSLSHTHIVTESERDS